MLLLLLPSCLANPADDGTGVRQANTTNNPSSMTDGLRNSEICEARSINYITHVLPQSCLTTSWMASSPTTTTSVSSSKPAGYSQPGTETNTSQPSTALLTHNPTEAHSREPAATTFMSFEDWKEMMLRRTGQDPQDLRSRKPNEQVADDRYPSDTGHAGLGEEGEISLNFEAYRGGDDQGASRLGATGADNVEHPAVGDALVHEDGKTATVHLSKDAGKTCKERFSYSSFDAGATVLKTSPGAKNARAILVENKDTYMLLECDAPSKYVIVELSDDISVDTVVLANFEFFSSMVRHFRVSVSDRYPVKLDKWRDLGTFEARNSRDIQPFLIENPQIWAKYVRIEFLTRFGNEYYCPVSLLRIHGSRMLDSWKDSESGRDEEALIDGNESHENDVQQNPSTATDATVSKDTGSIANPTETAEFKICKVQHPSSIFAKSETSCPAVPPDEDCSRNKDPRLPSLGPKPLHDLNVNIKEPDQAGSAVSLKSYSSTSNQPDIAVTTTPTNFPTEDTSGDRIAANIVSNGTDANERNTVNDRQHNATAIVSKSSSSGGPTGKLRGSGTSAASAASPTMQEGFFNAITKRIQYLESNLTLSVKYVEDQSKHVQEALHLGEQKQQTRVSHFLEDLNRTVLAELHSFREQYDQIWQSTVLALDSQRDRSERDMMALTTRLNLLADEVVFQKRMAIIQAIILLSCLFLIIFSRGVSLPSLAPLLDQLPDSVDAPSSSMATPRRPMYKQNKIYDDKDVALVSSGSTDIVWMPSPDPSRDASPSSVARETLNMTSSDNTSTGSSLLQRSSLLHIANPSDDDAMMLDNCGFTTGSDSNAMHLAVGTTHVTSRKPLPSLPEHPRSRDQD